MAAVVLRGVIGRNALASCVGISRRMYPSASVASLRRSLTTAEAVPPPASADIGSIARPAFVVPKDAPPVTIVRQEAPPQYSCKDAISQIKAKAKTHETFESSFKVTMKDSTLKKGRSRDPIRTTIVLPHTFQKEKTVIVLAEGAQAAAAAAAGASIVGGEELLQRIKSGEVKYDVILASTEAAQKLKRLAGAILRQDTPTAKKGTLADDVAALVPTFSRGVQLRSDVTGNVCTPFASPRLTEEQAQANLEAVVEALLLESRSGRKGFIQRMHLSSTQGAGYQIGAPEIERLVKLANDAFVQRQ